MNYNHSQCVMKTMTTAVDSLGRKPPTILSWWWFVLFFWVVSLPSAVSFQHSWLVQSPSSTRLLSLTENDRNNPTPEPQQQQQHDNKFLYQDLSTPERYAQALNLSVEEVQAQKERRQQASNDLHKILQSSSLSGREKHQLQCQHLFQHGKHPFVCRDCWSYQPVCVCDNKHSVAAAVFKDHSTKDNEIIQNNTEVVVWTHHREWGLTSNTGIILSLTLPILGYQCRMLMKGLPEHDRIVEEILAPLSNNTKNGGELQTTTVVGNENDDETTNDDPPPLVVVLWPNVSKKTNTTQKIHKSDSPNDAKNQPTFLSMQTIKHQLQKYPQRKLVIIAIDGTWRNARRMVARLPSHLPRLDLSIDETFFANESTKNNNNNNNETALPPEDLVSILAPLRARGNDGSSSRNDPNDDSNGVGQRQVCTAEAVVGALVGMGQLHPNQGSQILQVARAKVEKVCRYRGKHLK